MPPEGVFRWAHGLRLNKLWLLCGEVGRKPWNRLSIATNWLRYGSGDNWSTVRIQSEKAAMVASAG